MWLILADAFLHFLPKRIAVRSLTRYILTACLGRILPAFAPRLSEQIGWGAEEDRQGDKCPLGGLKMLSETFWPFYLFFSVSAPTLELSSKSDNLAYSQWSLALPCISF